MKHLKTPMIFIVIIVLIVGLLIVKSNYDLLSPDGIRSFIKNDIITVVIVLIMVCMIVFDAISSRRKLNGITCALKNASRQFTDGHTMENVIESCNNDLIKKQLSAFYDEKINNKTNIKPDIDEYINEQVIAEITHREISDQIANALTGLGILGTFIGLTIGLENFNQNEILSSTNQLIAGIKTAFYTSIFGVIGSIVYNHYFHKDVEENNSALDEFIGIFHTKVIETPKMVFYNEMIKHNESEADAIAKAILPLMGELVTQSISPMMNRVNDSIDAYIVKAVESQSNILKMLVEDFMTQLNKAMDNQFHNLSYSIRDMCAWQNDLVESAKALIPRVNEVVSTLAQLNSDMVTAETVRKEINENSLTIVETGKKCIDEITMLSSTISGWIDDIKTETQKVTECHMSIKEFAEFQTTETTALVERFETVMQSFERYQSEVERVATKYGNVSNGLIKAMEVATNQMKSYEVANNANLEKNARQLGGAIDRLISFNDEMIDNLNFVSEQFAVIEQNMAESTNQTRRFLETADEMIREIEKVEKTRAEQAE